MDERTDLISKGGDCLGGKTSSSYFHFKSTLGAYYAEYGSFFPEKQLGYSDMNGFMNL